MLSSISHTFRAFRHRNYALFFCGQSVSQIGTWMQRTAVSWLIYSITHSAVMLGFAVFAQQFPSFLLSLYGGIISDRYSKYRILLITQSASLVQASLLALLVLSGYNGVWGILSLSVVLGVINAFDVPARQPMIHEMLGDKDDLTNALALNSAMVNVARILGPALSGIVLLRFGSGVCFLSNAVSFLAVITSLLLMKLPPYVPHPERKKAVNAIAEGFSYVRNTPAISKILLLLSLSSLLVIPYDTLMPVFAKIVFKGDAATYGYISSLTGVGAICGTIFLASRKKGTDLKPVLLFCSCVLAVGMISFASVSSYPLAKVCAVVLGFGVMGQNTTCITIIQVESIPAMRGRMMSYVGLCYFGMLPLGSLLVGWVSNRIGAPHTLLCQGILSAIITALFFRHLKNDKLTEEAKEIIMDK
jgi:MFS family permease